jgi:hypothetical protein
MMVRFDFELSVSNAIKRDNNSIASAVRCALIDLA